MGIPIPSIEPQPSPLAPLAGEGARGTRAGEGLDANEERLSDEVHSTLEVPASRSSTTSA